VISGKRLESDAQIKDLPPSLLVVHMLLVLDLEKSLHISYRDIDIFSEQTMIFLPDEFRNIFEVQTEIVYEIYARFSF
jgi:hypothetical protein